MWTVEIGQSVKCRPGLPNKFLEVPGYLERIINNNKENKRYRVADCI